jgi:hypothetical protein
MEFAKINKIHFLLKESSFLYDNIYFNILSSTMESKGIQDNIWDNVSIGARQINDKRN